MGKWCTVILREDVKRRLNELRSEMGVRSINDVISRLIEYYEKSRSEVIRITMCNDFSQSTASYQGWVRLLAKKGFSPREIAEALNYLTGTLNELRVDRKKCEEGTHWENP
ncbi:MAG: hypothetical protein QXM71_07525 [Thermofilum sp.]